MKQLFIARHGKAETTSQEGTDLARRLTDVGVERTRRIAENLRDNQLLPDLILSSNAERAFSTALLFADILTPTHPSVEVESPLYMATPDEVFQLLGQLDLPQQKLMLVAHNPTMALLVHHFLGVEPDSFPTSGVVVVDLPIDSWAQAKSALGVLRHRIWPSML